MTRFPILVGLALTTAACASAPRFEVGPAAHDRYIARALEGVPPQAAAGIRALCAAPTPNQPPSPPGPPHVDDPASRVTPARVFDDLYFIGDKDVSVWALSTSAGIVLFDASFDTLVKERVEAGLRAVGRDPKEIKYVIVTHGHDDHYGGAKYLQETYGARIIMGAADWRTRPAPGDAPMPRKDIAVGDRTLMVGSTPIRIVATPGHTPGTISLLFPVNDRSGRHMVALWGGGYPNQGGVAAMKAYVASIERFRPIARSMGADVSISNHPKNDESLGKLRQLAANPSGPNPFVQGTAMVERRSDVVEACTRAWIALNDK